MAVGATDPGVKVGSSSGFLRPGPFQGLPGSNSGMPKASMPLRASLLELLAPTEVTETEVLTTEELLVLLGPPGPTLGLLSGQPELVELEDKPQVSSPPKGELVFLALPLAPFFPGKRLSLSFHWESLDPPTFSETLPLPPKVNSLKRSGMEGSFPVAVKCEGGAPDNPDPEEPIFWLFKYVACCAEIWFCKLVMCCFVFVILTEMDNNSRLLLMPFCA